MTMLMIALGAIVGAPARYLTDKMVSARHRTVVPWGTLTVNVVACLVLGAVTGGARKLNPDVVTLIGPGFCATLSTYSAFGYETVRLVEGGARLPAFGYVALSVLAGIGAARLGYGLGSIG